MIVNYPVKLSHRRSITVSIETHPLYSYDHVSFLDTTSYSVVVFLHLLELFCNDFYPYCLCLDPRSDTDFQLWHRWFLPSSWLYKWLYLLHWYVRSYFTWSQALLQLQLNSDFVFSGIQPYKTRRNTDQQFFSRIRLQIQLGITNINLIQE